MRQKWNLKIAIIWFGDVLLKDMLIFFEDDDDATVRSEV